MNSYDVKCRIIEEELKTFWPEWHVIRILGGGAFGDVFEIYKDVFGIREKSALKMVQIRNETEAAALIPFMGEAASDRQDGQTDTEIPEALRNEIQIMEALQGAPNIVAIKEFHIKRDASSTMMFVRMELLTSFRQIMAERQRKQQPFTIPEVLKIGKDICTALMYCETKGIIHRDIKPANLFIDGFGNYKVGDFGVSRRMDTVHVALTMTGIGTISYMAPEVYKGNSYNNTVDIYALGLILYQLLNNGRIPFLPTERSYTTKDIDSANYKRLHGEPLPSLTGTRIGNETVDASLDAMIRKACAIRSEDRYQRAKAFYDDLNVWAASRGRQPGEDIARRQPGEDIARKQPGEDTSQNQLRGNTPQEKQQQNISQQRNVLQPGLKTNDAFLHQENEESQTTPISFVRDAQDMGKDTSRNSDNDSRAELTSEENVSDSGRSQGIDSEDGEAVSRNDQKKVKSGFSNPVILCVMAVLLICIGYIIIYSPQPPSNPPSTAELIEDPSASDEETEGAIPESREEAITTGETDLAFEKIVFGTNAEYPPFEFLSSTGGVIGEFDGIDMAIASQIGTDLGVEISITDTEFDALLTTLKNGEIDAVISGMSITEERRENFDFTIPYYNATQVMIVRGDSDIEKASDLEGKEIAVIEGKGGETFVKEMGYDNVTYYQDRTAAIMGLNSGKVDAIVIDSSLAWKYVNDNSDLNLSIIEDNEQFYTEEYAIAVRKGDTELLNALNAEIEKMTVNGIIDKYIEKYNAAEQE